MISPCSRAALALFLLLALPACESASNSKTDTASPQDTGPTAACAGWDSELAAMEEEVLDLVNEVRAQGYQCYEGWYDPTDPLLMNEQLRCAARLHSMDMAENGFFDHTGSDGSQVTDRVEAMGYTDWMAVGENIAGGTTTASASVQGWLDSTSGHCGNIMEPLFEDIGIGTWFDAESPMRWYWTQDFGSLL